MSYSERHKLLLALGEAVRRREFSRAGVEFQRTRVLLSRDETFIRALLEAEADFEADTAAVKRLVAELDALDARAKTVKETAAAMPGVLGALEGLRAGVVEGK